MAVSEAFIGVYLAARKRLKHWGEGREPLNLSASMLAALEAAHGTVTAALPEPVALVPIGPSRRPLLQMVEDEGGRPMVMHRWPKSRMGAGCTKHDDYHRWPATDAGADAAASWAVRHWLNHPECEHACDWFEIDAFMFEGVKELGWQDHDSL